MPKFAANLTMLFNELPFLDRFAAAAEAGFTGVEYLFPYDFDKQNLRERLDRYGLTQVLHNLPAGNWGGGERGIAIQPERVGEFRDGVARAIDYAGALGCSQLNCLAGIAPKGADPERLRETFIGNLDYAARALKDAGIKLLIEADQHPRYSRLLPQPHQRMRPRSSTRSARTTSSSSTTSITCRSWREISPAPSKPTCRASRICSSPTIPGGASRAPARSIIAFLFKKIDSLGYQGWIGCEYKPATTTTEGLGWFAPYAKR